MDVGSSDTVSPSSSLAWSSDASLAGGDTAPRRVRAGGDLDLQNNSQWPYTQRTIGLLVTRNIVRVTGSPDLGRVTVSVSDLQLIAWTAVAFV